MGDTPWPRPGRDTHGAATVLEQAGGGRQDNEPISGQVSLGKRSASSAGGSRGRALLSPRQPNHTPAWGPGTSIRPPTLRNTHPPPQHRTPGAAYGPVLYMGHLSRWRRARTHKCASHAAGAPHACARTHTHARTHVRTHMHRHTHACTPRPRRRCLQGGTRPPQG